MMGLTHAALINSTLSGEMLKKTKKDLIKKTTKMDLKFYEQLMTVNVKKFCNFI